MAVPLSVPVRQPARADRGGRRLHPPVPPAGEGRALRALEEPLERAADGAASAARPRRSASALSVLRPDRRVALLGGGGGGAFVPSQALATVPRPMSASEGRGGRSGSSSAGLPLARGARAIARIAALPHLASHAVPEVEVADGQAAPEDEGAERQPEREGRPRSPRTSCGRPSGSRARRPGVPGATSPASSWVRTPIGRATSSETNQMMAKRTKAPVMLTPARARRGCR